MGGGGRENQKKEEGKKERERERERERESERGSYLVIGFLRCQPGGGK